jgi:CRISP-associated protein Cas1
MSGSANPKPDPPASGTLPGFTPPRPIPLKERSSIIFVERAQLDVIDGAFVALDATGIRTHIPVGGFACVMLEPGTRISHAAVALAARAGTLIVWVGEAGVRLYASGQPGGARADRLLHQARLALDENTRLAVVRRMFEVRFDEAAPTKRSIDQLRGIEGARVRATYERLAKQYGVPWKRRAYNISDWDSSDLPNRCLSSATACLHGLAEAAVLAAGYAPAIGFLHTGRPLSFVYDIADLFKFETVVPAAFEVAGKALKGKLDVPAESAVRRACRDAFRRTNLLERIIPAIEDVLAASGINPPPEPEEAQHAVLHIGTGAGDAGHRG